jgi:membrane-associated phospholipid phosphatase
VHRPSSYSFPSGHTSSAFAASIALLCCNRKWGIPVTIFAAFMGFSRIYVQVHYCTDVLAGIVASYLAQGYSPIDATKFAVYIHSFAADKAVLKRSQHALLPTDIIEEL